MLSCFSHVRLFITLWTVARQASLSMGFFRKEYWSVLPCPPPGDLPDPEINPSSLMSPALAGRFLTTSATWEANLLSVLYKIKIPRAPCLHTLGILFKSRSWVFSLAEMEAITSFSNGMKTVIKWLCHLFLSRLTNPNYFLTFSHGPFFLTFKWIFTAYLWSLSRGTTGFTVCQSFSMAIMKCLLFSPSLYE